MPEQMLTLGGDEGGPITLVSAAAERATSLHDWNIASEMITGFDRAFVVGRYCHGGMPANRNGHIFRDGELATAHRRIVHTPLDMLHRPDRIIGTHAASKYVRPDAQAATPDPTFANAPFVKVLGCVWAYHYPDETQKIAEAFDRGNAFLSHSCLPAMCECPECGHRAPWLGYVPGVDNPTAEQYCNHMGGLGNKEFEDPHFLGGAIILPPVKPGWSDAYITKVEQVGKKRPKVVDAAFEHIRAAAADVTDLETEDLVGQMLHVAYKDDPVMREAVSRFTAFAKDWKDHGAERQVASVEYELAQAEQHTSVIIALVPPPDACEALAALGTQPADEIHLTLAYLGHVDGDSVVAFDGETRTTTEALAAALAVWSDGETPISAKTSGIGELPTTEMGRVEYVTIDAPGLNELVFRLNKALAAAGIPVSTQHGFTPHITVSVDGPNLDAAAVLGHSWLVDQVEVWWAGTHVSLELG